MRRALTRPLVATVVAALLASPVAAQSSATRTGLEPELQAGISFVTTLIVGLMLVSNLEGYTARVGDIVRGRPTLSFAAGVAVFVGFLVAVFVCALLGVIGGLLLLVLALGFAVLSVAGNAIAYIAVFAPLVGRLPALLLAALVAAGFAYLPAIGATVALVGRVVGGLLGTVGLGAMAIVYRT